MHQYDTGHNDRERLLTILIFSLGISIIGNILLTVRLIDTRHALRRSSGEIPELSCQGDK